MSKRTRKRKSRAPARFKVGQRVRVRQGIRDEDYPDMPLGGWVGTISEVYRSGMYCVRWSRETLAAIHPIYKKRCTIDGMDVYEYWLREDDLEPDPGGPLAIQQPTRIVPRRLSTESQADRVRVVFGLTGDEYLPEVDDESLETYYDYLDEHFSLPAEARYVPEDGLFLPSSRRNVTAVTLDGGFPWDDGEGIFCEVRTADGKDVVPLSRLLFRRSDPNHQLVEDFTAWLEDSLAEDEDSDEWLDGWDEADDEMYGELDEVGATLSESAIRRSTVAMAVELVAYTAACGGLLGVTMAAMSWAKQGACIGAGLWAVAVILMYWRDPPADLGIRNVTARRLSAVLIGGIAGLVQGAVFGSLAVAFVGTAFGAIVGGLLRKAFPLRWRPTFELFPGMILGAAAIGAAAQGFYLDPPAARLGLCYGASIGAGMGTLFLLGTILSAVAHWAFAKRRGFGRD